MKVKLTSHVTSDNHYKMLLYIILATFLGLPRHFKTTVELHCVLFYKLLFSFSNMT